ncbi:hypothetical protein 3Fb_00036 [Ralstonia phage Eline]|uniref:AP2/ERF domain-containing protein n=3 Tax=Caudoviricetes TaxID=2731619 RepID=A0A7G5B9R6_9CAUD|nr:HNH endonuclease [Ralstonia phage Eline]YP_010078610.1 HNH endonuclease [Ralstonia phage Claudette]QMV32512.1 adaptor protein 3 [Ralstonia phage Alix]QMV32727.1 hypothetical protein 20Ca_00020 [Ralstonia phage Claudette]QMV33039.1 hypothetical protein 3Fb_00036 [Ralstonia phage Eline]
MELTQARIRELFGYCDGKLVSKVDRHTLKAGTEITGTINSKGYLCVWFDGKSHLVHRVIFLLHHGYLPEEIDHRDLDKLNNRIDNLRDASHGQNMANRGIFDSNRSGYKGVHWSKRRGKWEASIRSNGKLMFLGYFSDPKDAHEAYKKAAERLHGDFARVA